MIDECGFVTGVAILGEFSSSVSMMIDRSRFKADLPKLFTVAQGACCRAYMGLKARRP
jgi:hypothetical protein